MAPVSSIMMRAAMQVQRSGLLPDLQPSAYLSNLDFKSAAAARYFPTHEMVVQLSDAFSKPVQGGSNQPGGSSAVQNGRAAGFDTGSSSAPATVGSHGEAGASASPSASGAPTSTASSQAAAATLLIAAVATEDGSRSLGSMMPGFTSGLGIGNGLLNGQSSGNVGGDEESGAEEDAAAEARRPKLTFEGMTEGQVAQYLLTAFREPEQQRKAFEKYVHDLGIPAIREIAEEAERLALSGQELVKDQHGQLRPRTAGGIFLRLAKQRKADKFVKSYMTTTETMTLRPYQAAAVDHVEGRRDINHIIVAPTGSGKTAIFVDIARRQLEAKPDSKILVLVPTIPLTVQHYTQFQRAGFHDKRWCVEHISSDKPLQAADWGTFLSRQSVIICVHQCLLNLLATGEASLDQLDLLVLDECHHTAKDHPYKRIMDYYKPGLNKRTRVIGFTASPASNVTMASMINEVEALKTKMRAELFIIHESDALVQAVAPSPIEREIRVARRQSDVDMERLLHGFLLQSAAQVGIAMMELTASPVAVTTELKGQAKAILFAVKNAATAGSSITATPFTAATAATAVHLMAKSSPQKDLVSATAELKQAMVAAGTFAQLYDLRRLLLCFKFLSALRNAMELVQEIGYEGAYQYLARKMVDLCCQHNAISGTTPSGLASGSGAGPGPTMKIQFKDSIYKTMPGLAKLAETAPLPESLVQRSTSLAATAAARLRSEGATCADLGPTGPPSVVSLGAKFLALPALREMELVLSCFPSGMAVKQQCFPKWWALLEFLVEQHMKSGPFHGMVFVQSRQAVYHIVDVINRTQQLDFLTALPFIGHGNKKPKHDAGSTDDRHLHGMTGSQQQAALDSFKAPGCKLLVATTAAEEGIDVQSCEFVVRYSAAATGVQRVQSRGRSRMAGSLFLQIIQEDTFDGHLHQKSLKEEDNMLHYLTESHRHQQAQAGGSNQARQPAGRAVA